MEYWERAVQELCLRDPVIKGLVDRYGDDRLRGSGDPFKTLCNAIVGQQISTAAAGNIWRRLNEALPEFSAAALLAASGTTLQACGLSQRKIEYLRGIADAVLKGNIDFAALENAEDDEVRQALCAIRGIGPWTAEMFLVFHLRRPDILPLGDVALQRACAAWYGWPNQKGPHRSRLEELGQTWRPWRTVATWYLWRDLDSTPIVY
jgi:DNA-3-methyladenine glycosylase II